MINDHQARQLKRNIAPYVQIKKRPRVEPRTGEFGGAPAQFVAMHANKYDLFNLANKGTNDHLIRVMNS